MFSSPFSYIAPSSRQPVYPARSRGNPRGNYFFQEPNFWEYDQQAAAEREYRERLAQLQREEKRRNAYLRQQQQLEEQYRLQQQQEHEQAMLEEQQRLQQQKEREQEMLEEKQRLKQLKSKKKRHHRKDRHIKRIPVAKAEQSRDEIDQDKVVYQPNLPNRKTEPQPDNDMFFDALTGNFTESETENETKPESGYSTPNYVIDTASDNASLDSPRFSDSESESDHSTYTSTLKTLESKINVNVDIYNRISSALSRDTGAPDTNKLNSRLKMVQRAQIELEKIYETLDDLTPAPTPTDKQLKQQLTKTAVAYADKTELLFKTIKSLLDEAKAVAPPKKKVLLETVPDEELSC